MLKKCPMKTEVCTIISAKCPICSFGPSPLSNLYGHLGTCCTCILYSIIFNCAFRCLTFIVNIPFSVQMMRTLIMVSIPIVQMLPMFVMVNPIMMNMQVIILICHSNTRNWPSSFHHIDDRHGTGST